MVVIESSWINNHILYLQSVPITTNVVREKIFLEINQSETRMACGGYVC